MKLFNTLSAQLETLEPLQAGEVRMYTCGPTVYDFAHIGNFRTFVFEDLLRRFLEFEGLKVRHVMNITDVDDKTLAGAKREGISLDEFTAKYITAFQEDCRKLNILPPHQEPRATQHIPDMLNLVQTLVQKGIAYERDGSVYYRVSKFANYGKLSKKDLSMNREGARVDVDEYDKEEGADFVLWKKSKVGEASWDSPWGKGRPGWHLECSAMSMKYLGESFDLHAGGEDLIFPHHENEIAQSEGVTGKLFVKYWLHSKHLLVNGEKMSKSKGNFYTLRDLLAKGYDPAAIRCALLATHYRSPLNFTLQALKEAGELIKKLDECFYQCTSRLQMGLFAKQTPGYAGVHHQRIEEIKKYLEEDLNVAAAFASLQQGVTKMNALVTQMSLGDLEECVGFFQSIDRIFGFNVANDSDIPESIVSLLKKRDEVRADLKVRNDKALWQDSDKLRDEIQSLGWIVKDGKPGEISTVRKKRRAWDK